MSRDTRRRLADAIDAATEAIGASATVTLEEFAAGGVVYRAIERCVFIVGEALANVPAEVRDRHPEVPWREIIGMRNILAHGYFRIDPMVLWTTVQRDFVELVATLRTIDEP